MEFLTPQTGAVKKYWGRLRETVEVSKILQETYVKTKLPRLPRLPNCGKLLWVECSPNAKRKLWQTGKNCHSFGSLPLLKTVTVSQKDSPDCHSFSKKSPKTAKVSENCPSLRNCRSFGSLSRELSQFGKSQESGLGITTTSRTKNSIDS